MTAAASDRRRRSRALLRRVARQHRHLLGAAVVAGVGWQLAGLVVPIVVGWTVERGIVGEDRSAVWWGAAVLIGLGAIEAASAMGRHRMACAAYMGSQAGLRLALTDAALRLDDEARASFPPGEVLARETSDTDTIGGFFDAVGHTIAEALSIPVILVALFLIDPLVAAAVAVVVPITALVMWRSSAAWDRRSAAAQAAMGTTVERAQEAVEGFKVLRGIGAEGAAVDRFRDSSTELRERSIDVGRLWLLFDPLLESLSVLSVAAVLWVGGNRVIDGDLDLGQIVTAIGFVLFLAGPVRTVGERILTLQGALASADRVVELLDAAAPSETGGSDPRPEALGLDLEAVDLSVRRLGGANDALVEVPQLVVPAGSLVVLDGSTGSGKSTLLATLAGLRRPSRGEVRLGGIPVVDWPSDVLRRRIVLCGPAPFLFAGSIAQNLRFAARDADDQELWHALDAAECGFVRDLPDGLDSEISERGVTLSGGQRQRLALARSALATPAILVIDGGTSALDQDTETRVVERIRSWLPGVSIVIVTSNGDLHERADQVVAIDRGRLGAMR